MIELLGIKNCDKVRAARKWLDSANVEYTFRDIRENPVLNENWEKWLSHFGWEILINRRSTSWKQLNQSQKNEVNNNSAIFLLFDNPTLMKRPLLIIDGKPQLLGFKPQQFEEVFSHKKSD